MKTVFSSKEKFVAAAADHGRFTVSGSSKACNNAYDKIVMAVHELAELPDRGAAIFADLLSYPDDSVKSWAAGYLLRFDPNKAMKTLEDVASRSGLIGFSAGMTLKEWRAGRLKLP